MKFASLKMPGLFITATDTEIGKTLVTCAIAAVLRRSGVRVGVCKPIASGCRHDREGLVSEDAEALAHFANSPFALDIINPVRYRHPLAPAVAAEFEKRPIDDAAIDYSLTHIAEQSDVMLVEGVGGVMVPLDDQRTVIDLMQAVGYPVVVVTSNRLGTLSHTAAACAAIRAAGLTVAGLVINRHHVDTPDLVEATNPRWLAKQNRTTVLATIPEVTDVAPQKAQIPPAVTDAIAMTHWLDIAAPQRVR